MPTNKKLSALTALTSPTTSTLFYAAESGASYKMTLATLNANIAPLSANISDATATGRAVLTAASQAAARTAIGAGTGSGDALVASPLSQFASTTSLQLKGVISDETGSGSLVFATSPTLVTPNIGVATATSINGAAITTLPGGQFIIDGSGASAARLDLGDDSILSVGDASDVSLSGNGSLNIGAGGTLGSLAFLSVAPTATALATARNINGVSFDGTANITVTAAAGTLTGTTLNSSVVTSSLTSVGTLGTLTVSGKITSGAGTEALPGLTVGAAGFGLFCDSGSALYICVNGESIAVGYGSGGNRVFQITNKFATPAMLNTNSGATALTFSTGGVTISNLPLSLLGSTPASAGASGVQGTVTWDSDYLYVATGTNTWKRVAIASW